MTPMAEKEQQAGADPYAATRARFEGLIHRLDDPEVVRLSHAELEEVLDADGREVLRQLLQDHLDLRSVREQRSAAVVDREGVPRSSVEPKHKRTLTTLFGDVRVTRLAYRERGHSNLHPADAHLNLPAEQYSHGLRKRAAIEASRDSFAEAGEAIRRATGQQVGKRQVEQLAQRAAVDFDRFYAETERPTAAVEDVLALSFDGKGIVMRQEALRPATAAAAAEAATKPTTRLSKDEKSHRKRMAELGVVYDATPVPRTPADILGPPADTATPRAPAPTAKGKWLTASVVQSPATVIASAFDEAQRRDPEHRRPWVALVDGNNVQIDCIRAQAQARQVGVTIVLDFIHVLEYLWNAAACFFPAGSSDAETWVQEKGRAVLAGHAVTVAAAIRRKATCRKLAHDARHHADVCADYLLRKRACLDYPTALQRGWPIATGVIEGACRHLVKDRLDLTGARWGLLSAEAVLKLRALRTNDDFDRYWKYHLAAERHRVHATRYAGDLIPGAA